MRREPLTRKVSLGPADVRVERDARGRYLLRHAAPLGAWPPRLTHRLLR